LTLLSIARRLQEPAASLRLRRSSAIRTIPPSYCWRLLNKGGKKLAWKPWEILQKEYTFATVAATATIRLSQRPEIFPRLHRVGSQSILGATSSLSPSEWQRYKSGTQTTTPRTRFRIKGGLIYLDPTPGGVDNLVIEYISRNWVTDVGGCQSGQFIYADAQVSLIDEDLLELDLTWRFLERKGLAYAKRKTNLIRSLNPPSVRDVPKIPVNAGIDYENLGRRCPPCLAQANTG